MAHDVCGVPRSDSAIEETTRHPRARLPLLLVLVDAVAARTECDDQQQAAGNRQRLKEVVLDKVTAECMHGHHPPRVEVYVDAEQPRHKHERCKPRLVADGNQHYKSSADDVLYDRQR